MEHSIDPANGVEPVPIISPECQFKTEVIIRNKEQALKKVKKY